MDKGKPQPHRESTQIIQQEPSICVFREWGRQTAEEMDT